MEHTNSEKPWASTSVGLAVDKGHVDVGVLSVPDEVVDMSIDSIEGGGDHQQSKDNGPSNATVSVVGVHDDGGNDVQLHVDGKIPSPQEALAVPDGGNKVVDVKNVSPPVLAASVVDLNPP